MARLLLPSPAHWLPAVMSDFDTFLLDHAACERKASATAMSFVVRCHDKPLLCREMIHIAQEELEHFRRVYELIEARQIKTCADQKDPYVNALRKQVRNGAAENLLDRLVLGGVVEARGAERFGLIAAALELGDLKDFYLELTRSEARHQGSFLRLAKNYFDETAVEGRLDVFLKLEAEIIISLPARPALH